MGSAKEWGECGGHYRENIEWARAGSGESCSGSLFLAHLEDLWLGHTKSKLSTTLSSAHANNLSCVASAIFSTSSAGASFLFINSHVYTSTSKAITTRSYNSIQPQSENRRRSYKARGNGEYGRRCDARKAKAGTSLEFKQSGAAGFTAEEEGGNDSCCEEEDGS